MSHTSKRILVTGGSRGIGYGIAKRFASLGASTILVSKHAAQLETARRSLPILSGLQKHVAIVGDVGDPEFWEHLKRSEKDVDVLVNAAGIAQNSLLISTSVETIEAIFRVNLLGTTLACRAMGRNMFQKKRGCIINISSLLGFQKPTPGSAVYAASKAGVIGLTRTMAAELGPVGVRTNVIVPGYIETDMTLKMAVEARENARNNIPVGKFGTVEDVADAAVFLETCSYMNGAEIVVDGGLGVA